MRDFDDFLKDKVDIRGSNLGRGEHFNLNGRECGRKKKANWLTGLVPGDARG